MSQLKLLKCLMDSDKEVIFLYNVIQIFSIFIFEIEHYGLISYLSQLVILKRWPCVLNEFLLLLPSSCLIGTDNSSCIWRWLVSIAAGMSQVDSWREICALTCERIIEGWSTSLNPKRNISSMLIFRCPVLLERWMFLHNFHVFWGFSYAKSKAIT